MHSETERQSTHIDRKDRPLGRAVQLGGQSQAEGGGEAGEKDGREERARRENASPGKSWQLSGGEVVLSENGHLMVCRACDRYVM